MKKLISLALALSMALTMAACGNTGWSLMRKNNRSYHKVHLLIAAY